MRWVLLILLILGPIVFNNLFLNSKNTLTAAVNLQPLAEPEVISEFGRTAIVAEIFSTYPFNHRNFLTLNAGSRHGVAVGQTVTVNENLLLGQIVEVSDKQSVAKTIFDNSWSQAVRIAPTGTDALLVGGQTPLVTLIDRKAGLVGGEKVYSASKDFPYGIELGVLGELVNSQKNSLFEARLKLNYSLNNVGKAIIFTDN
ncbi:MAG: hypothetical protein HYT03_02945 [Candidatus Harrisonbacteria bacterium]|nr:hypothetical protein [Candidatus Harrisonbacteria bacterium]